jgi:hypothetical protein
MNPDLMAMLQGGGAPAGPPAPDMGGGLPPDMAALLGGGGEMPEEDLSPEGALHGGSAAEGDPEEFYREALDALEQGMKADTDEQRINTIMQCATKIQGELAGSQKGSDAMLGGKMDPATMRRMGAPDQAY